MKKISLYSWSVSAATLIAGGLMLYFKVADYGFSFFMLFPTAVGFSIGHLTFEKQKRAQWISMILGLLFSLIFLVIVGVEGIVCVLMALPLLAILMVIGFWIARLTKKYFVKNKKNAQLSVLAFPLIFLIFSNFVERILAPEPQLITVTNSVLLRYPSDKVFDEIKSMDKLDGEKSMLLQLGLPTPYKCILDGDSVGAKRICLYENGQISCEITEFRRGDILRMKVNEYTLTGNHWFKFESADYTFEKKLDGTLITRHTLYKSSLKPRFYWQPLELLGIEQEHKFVLASLKKNLEEKYGSK